MLGYVGWRPLLIAVRLAISFLIGDRCGFKLSLRHCCCLATGLLGWPARQFVYGFIKIYVVAEMLMDLILCYASVYKLFLFHFTSHVAWSFL
jgi:hypothetical protein